MTGVARKDVENQHRSIDDRERLDAYPFYSAAFGELESRRGNAEGARTHFTRALRHQPDPRRRARRE